VSTLAGLRITHGAGNNAHVPAKSSVRIGFLAFAIIIFATSGCSSQAEDFVSKIRAESVEKCNQGNQAACHTVVQRVSDTKVLIETTAPIEILTPACSAGKQEACQEMAVLHSELSAWCSTGNEQACAAVNIGPWPTKWDEPALIDAAKLSCLRGQFKPESHTCQALDMM
jgi:hypothetical protein